MVEKVRFSFCSQSIFGIVSSHLRWLKLSILLIDIDDIP